MRYFIYVVIGAVALMILGGFFLIGSPREERMRRFDEQRVQSLQYIQSELVNYWQNKGKLPERLSDLNDDIRGFRVPVDPETGAQYDYETKGSETFSLCAVFKTSSDASATPSDANYLSGPRKPVAYHGGYDANQIWEHGAERQCFERTIDKDIYAPKPLQIIPR